MKVDPTQARGDFVPGELLVKFRSGLSRARERVVHARFGARVLKRIDGGLGVHHVKLPPGLQVAAAARRYEASPAVEYAEPNFYRYPAFTPDDPDFAKLWGLDNTGQQHPLPADDQPPATAPGTADADMDVVEAWETEKGDPGVVVAVLDSGVDVSHEDLAGNLWENAAEAAGTLGVDDDGNGKIDDINGWDFAEENATLLDVSTALGYDHGTHVAGSIAAVTNNATGVAGICGGNAAAVPAEAGCSIMVLKFMNNLTDLNGDGLKDMVGTLAAELAAIAYARAKGAHIINGSFGGPSWAKSEREAIRKAGALSDILFVAAAGNVSLDNDTADAFDLDGNFSADIFSPAYPASYNLPHILTVAASNHHDEYGYFTGCRLAGFTKPQCAFTNFGRRTVDVAAPGVDILSTLPGDAYGTFNGTSMAAPHVSGLAGLLLAQDPTRPALTVKNFIMATANTTDEVGNPLPLSNSMNTALFANRRLGKFTRTAGRVNAEDALSHVGVPPNGSANDDGDIPGARGMRAKATGSVSWPADVNDVKKKKLRKGKTYRLTLVVPRGKDYDLFLYKPSAKEIWQPRRFGGMIKGSAQGRGADEVLTYKAAASRVYFFHVGSYYSNGKYTLLVKCLTC